MGIKQFYNGYPEGCQRSLHHCDYRHNVNCNLHYITLPPPPCPLLQQEDGAVKSHIGHYWRQIGVVAVTCVFLFVYEFCERYEASVLLAGHWTKPRVLE